MPNVTKQNHDRVEAGKIDTEVARRRLSLAHAIIRNVVTAIDAGKIEVTDRAETGRLAEYGKGALAHLRGVSIPATQQVARALRELHSARQMGSTFKELMQWYERNPGEVFHVTHWHRYPDKPDCYSSDIYGLAGRGLVIQPEKGMGYRPTELGKEVWELLKAEEAIR